MNHAAGQSQASLEQEPPQVRSAYTVLLTIAGWKNGEFLTFAHCGREFSTGRKPESDCNRRSGPACPVATRLGLLGFM